MNKRITFISIVLALCTILCISFSVYAKGEVRQQIQLTTSLIITLRGDPASPDPHDSDGFRFEASAGTVVALRVEIEMPNREVIFWVPHPYQLSTDSEVLISIYDTQGERVRQLDLGYQHVGTYVTRGRAAYWDGKDMYGETVASGLYFYQIRAGAFSASRKMVVLK